jgi:hypothetical protein
VIRTIHQLSAFFFYVLGATFFIAYMLLAKSVLGVWPAWWMQVADLPLVLTSLLYAGMSLYLSLRSSERHSWRLALSIGAPLIVFFVLLLVLNFWPK